MLSKTLQRFFLLVFFGWLKLTAHESTQKSVSQNNRQFTVKFK